MTSFDFLKFCVINNSKRILFSYYDCIIRVNINEWISTSANCQNFASVTVDNRERLGTSMSFPKSGHPHRVRRERSRGAERKGSQGVGNICGQVTKRVRLSTSVSGGAMVVVMATLGALAPSQPPDLQGVQIDARRRNNRRIGPRIGPRVIWWREDPVALGRLIVGHSSLPFVRERCLHPIFFIFIAGLRALIAEECPSSTSCFMIERKDA